MKETWDLWMEMAQESLLAARECQKFEHPRSAASRAYYAAYQAATAAIHYTGRATPPKVNDVQRESWQHDPTPFILETALAGIIRKRDDRKKLRSSLRELYNIRIQADYVASYNLFARDEALDETLRDMNRIVKAIQSILPMKGTS